MKAHSCQRSWSQFIRLVSIIAILACSLFSVAKDQDNNKQNPAAVTFTSRTELVLIPTLVTDKSGLHVGGLNKEDFSVYENGSERKIATFEEITSDPHRLVRPKNPNEFSNFLIGSDSNRRVTVIVLDFINTSFADQAYARQELLKYLAQSLDRREPTGLFTLTRSGVHVIHDFTSDPRVLQAALRRVRGDTTQLVDPPEEVEAVTGTASPDGNGGAEAGMVQTEAQQIQAMIEKAELNFKSFEQRLAITYTLEGMQQVAQALAGFPGRKSLIWAGGGFPFNVSDNSMQLPSGGRESLADVLPLYERTWELLNDAQIALYPVDVRGLRTLMAGPSIVNPGRNYVRNAGTEQLDTLSTFQTFAAATGGRAYFNSNDLVKGFHDAVRDSSQYYMIGYYLDRSNTKQGWRKLTVKVRRDHIQVRARNGFFVTRATTNSAAVRDNDISLALRSPLDYSALRLVARLGAVESSKEAGKKRLNFLVNVPPDPSLIDAADSNHLMIEFVAGVTTPAGLVVGRPVGKTFDLHPNAQSVATIQQKGIDYRGVLDLPPGEYNVHIVVRDGLSGRIGSVAAPLKVQ